MPNIFIQNSVSMPSSVTFSNSSGSESKQPLARLAVINEQEPHNENPQYQGVR